MGGELFGATGEGLRWGLEAAVGPCDAGCVPTLCRAPGGLVCAGREVEVSLCVFNHALG